MVNVFGLSIGLACTILALVFVMDEYSFDDFHSKSEDIYRINKFYTNDAGVTNKSAESSGLMGPQMLADFPEVKRFTRFQPWFDPQVISYGEKHISDENLAFTDSSFFQVFDFELVQGDPEEVLKNTKSIVLTESLAQKIFGTQNPMGEFINLFEIDFMVTGVMKDAPRNSHLQFSGLISWVTTLPSDGGLNFSFLNNWLAQVMNTYVELESGVNIEQLETKMADMLATHLPQRKDDYRLYLQHFPDIYLSSDDIQQGNFKLRLGSSNFVTIFNIIAVFVLLIAAVNYINISTAKAMRRGREVGVRKVLGAQKSQLFVQFVGEALFVSTLSGILAILIVDLSIPFFNEIADKHLTSSLLFKTPMVLLMIGVVLVTSFISGAYPALVLSSFKPSMVLKSGKGDVLKGGMLRKAMIVLQFSLASLMITCAIVVFDQNNFLVNKDTGLNAEQVIVVDINDGLARRADLLQTALEKHPDILNTSGSRATIGGGTYGTTVIPEGFENPIDIRFFRVDFDFIDVYGIDMVEGRAFDPEITTDRNGLVVNKAFIDFTNWEAGVEKTVKFSENGTGLPIIGVTEDFNYFGLNKSKIEPMVMYVDLAPTNLAIKVSGNNMERVLTHIEDTYDSFESKYPLEYYFVDEWFARQYQNEQNFLKIITIFCVLSILISSLGLYGLVSYFIEQRVNEIGVRKVLGASIRSITLMINGHFIKLILLSLLISIPIAYWLMSSWLADFAYRIDLTLLPFALSAILVVIIALFTTNNQALKASRRNPVESIRYE